MEVKSEYRYARISPFKVRDVTRAIQGMPVSKALDVLTFTPRKAAFLVGKTVKSAIANAENNHDLAVDTLVVKSAVVGEGPTIKRFRPRARGSASPIRKRTSHIRIILTDEIEIPEPKQRAKKKKKAAPKPKAKTEAAAPAPVEPEAAEPEPEEVTAETPVAAEEAPVAEAVVEETEPEAPAETDEEKK